MSAYMSAPLISQSKPPEASAEVKPSLTYMFTNGPVDTDDESKAKALSQVKASGMIVDSRPVLRLLDRDGEGVDVVVKSDDGTEQSISLAYIQHKPPTALNAAHLVDQLGLEKEKGPFGQYVKTTPFCTTNVPGVYACGDAGVMVTHVTTAMYTGNVVGSMVAHHLGDREMEAARQAVVEEGK
jgi:thioredoxin reductase